MESQTSSLKDPKLRLSSFTAERQRKDDSTADTSRERYIESL